ncbi:MAG: MEDS domain-containing protein, partial [Candidatus Omnitrophica bacterium]|nr:MEDS domain-containing protein [Candidatus Omnitrophota bacterium]
CLYYSSEEDYLNLVIPFLTRGLLDNQFCMWLILPQWDIEKALTELRKSIENIDAYIEKGQFEIVRCEEWYGLSATFNPIEMLGKWNKKEKDILARGFKGLWVCGDGSWVCDQDWEKLISYEASVDRIIDETTITALCTYSSNVFDISHVFILNFHHECTIQSKNGRLRIFARA